MPYGGSITLWQLIYAHVVLPKVYRCFCRNISGHFPWRQPKAFGYLILTWTRRLFGQVNPVLFLISAVTSFAVSTYAAYSVYGAVAIQEGLLYHFSRVDHRHNYSMYWYWIYLARARAENSLQMIGPLLLLPQVLLLVYSSLGIAPRHLGLTLFLQTFLFVTHNKVITAQYFTWYLCLLPLCAHHFRATRTVRYAVIGLLTSIGLWLGSAFLLEMQGMACHRFVWISSLIFFFANVHLMGALVRSVVEKEKQDKGD